MSSSLISIIIPIYNGAQTINRCIASLKKQTLKACEFIFIDDGSTDNTVEKFNELTKGDSRFVILKMGQRTDPFQARKKGILAASGKYIMFLDADDTFVEKGCEIAYKIISTKNVDIVLFGSKPVKSEGTSKEVFNQYKRYLRFEDKIRGIYRSHTECCKLYFQEKGFGFSTSLGKKIFSAELLKRVISKLDSDLYLGYGQDLFQLIATMEQVNSIYANNKLELYNYFIGEGVTQAGQSTISIEKYKRIIASHNSFLAINSFVAESEFTEQEKSLAIHHSKKSLLASAQKHLWNLSDTDIPLGLSLLYEAWGDNYLDGIRLTGQFDRIKNVILENTLISEKIRSDFHQKAISVLLDNAKELEQDRNLYKNSISYKIGLFITAPFRWIGRFFS